MPESFQYNSPQVELSVLATTGDWGPDDILFALTDNLSTAKKGTLFVKTKESDSNIVSSIVNYSKSDGSDFTVCSSGTQVTNLLRASLPSGSSTTKADIGYSQSSGLFTLFSNKNEALRASSTEVSIYPEVNSNYVNAGYIEVGEPTTNLLLRSQSFNVSPWVKSSNLTLTGSQSAPDSSPTAFLATGGSGSNFIYQELLLTSGNVYTFSIWLKTTGSSKEFSISLGNQDQGYKYTTCQVNTFSWNRYSVTVEAKSSANFIAQISSTGWDSGETLLIWGAQLENKPYATSYVATTTVQASSARHAIFTSIDKKVGINTSSPASGLDVSTDSILRSGLTVLGTTTLSTTKTSSLNVTSTLGVTGSSTFGSSLSITGAVTVGSSLVTSGDSFFLGDATFSGEVNLDTLNLQTSHAGDLSASEDSYNLVRYSTNFYGNSWSFYGLIYGSEINPLTPTEAPDGTMTGYNPQFTSYDFYVRQLISSLVSGQKYTFSVWLKKSSPDRDIEISIRTSDGITKLASDLVNVNTTWQRFAITGVVNSSSAYIYIGYGNSEQVTIDESIEIWGPQFEQKTFATGYIPNSTNSPKNALSSLTVTNLRRVGINQTNPVYDLDINTAAYLRSGLNVLGDTVLYNDETVYGDKTVHGDTELLGDVRISGNVYIRPNYNVIASGVGDNNEFSIDLLGQNTYTGNYWHIWSDKTGLGTILSARGDTGKVGIKTANPSTTLDVLGDGRFTTVASSRSFQVIDQTSLGSGWVPVLSLKREATGSAPTVGFGAESVVILANENKTAVTGNSVVTSMRSTVANNEKSDVDFYHLHSGSMFNVLSFSEGIVKSYSSIISTEPSKPVISYTGVSGTLYSVFIQAVDADGNGISISDPYKVDDLVLPSNQTFTWTKTEGAAYYRIWQASSPLSSLTRLNPYRYYGARVYNSFVNTGGGSPDTLVYDNKGLTLKFGTLVCSHVKKSFSGDIAWGGAANPTTINNIGGGSAFWPGAGQDYSDNPENNYNTVFTLDPIFLDYSPYTTVFRVDLKGESSLNRAGSILYALKMRVVSIDGTETLLYKELGPESHTVGDLVSSWYFSVPTNYYDCKVYFELRASSTATNPAAAVFSRTFITVHKL